MPVQRCGLFANSADAAYPVVVYDLVLVGPGLLLLLFGDDSGPSTGNPGRGSDCVMPAYDPRCRRRHTRRRGTYWMGRHDKE